MAKNGVKVVDRGWKRITQEWATFSGVKNRVGILQKNARRSDGGDNVIIGTAHEFGTSKLPERSWLRSAFDKNLDRLMKLEARLYGKSLDGRISAMDAIKEIGEQFRKMVQKNMRDLKMPALKPATLKRKLAHGPSGAPGFPSPLIDSGQMHDAVTSEPQGRRKKLRVLT